jgi:hypothetical protein
MVPTLRVVTQPGTLRRSEPQSGSHCVLTRSARHYTHLDVGRNKPVRPPWLTPDGLIPAYILHPDAVQCL